MKYVEIDMIMMMNGMKTCTELIVKACTIQD